MRGRLVLPKNYCNRYQRQLMVTTRRSDKKSWNDAMQTVTFNIRFHQFTCGCSHARKIKVVHGTSKEYHGGIPTFGRRSIFESSRVFIFFLERARARHHVHRCPEKQSQRRFFSLEGFFAPQRRPLEKNFQGPRAKSLGIRVERLQGEKTISR